MVKALSCVLLFGLAAGCTSSNNPVSSHGQSTRRAESSVVTLETQWEYKLTIYLGYSRVPQGEPLRVCGYLTRNEIKEWSGKVYINIFNKAGECVDYRTVEWEWQPEFLEKFDTSGWAVGKYTVVANNPNSNQAQVVGSIAAPPRAKTKATVP